MRNLILIKFVLENNIVSFLLPLLFSYIMGSLNFSILISRFFGEKKDIRSLGSNNAGFTNMLRSVGVLPSVLTFAGDFIKGVISMCFGSYFYMHTNLPHKELYSYLMLVELMCCVGHIYPCLFKFKGGKGILTTWACIFFVDWKIALCLISIFLITLILSKIISLSSIVVSLSYPILVFLFSNNFSFEKISFIPLLISFVVSFLLILRHKDNIKRLVEKKEQKIGVAKKHKN